MMDLLSLFDERLGRFGRLLTGAVFLLCMLAAAAIAINVIWWLPIVSTVIAAGGWLAGWCGRRCWQCREVRIPTLWQLERGPLTLLTILVSGIAAGAHALHLTAYDVLVVWPSEIFGVMMLM